MKTLIPKVAVALLVLIHGSVSAQSLPNDAQQLLKKHQASIVSLNETLKSELRKLKARCMKDGDLEGANAVAALIEDPQNASADGADSLVGTVWIFQGVNRQKINEFTFMKGGKVKCESLYENATWKRIDEKTILYGYGKPGEYIVFRFTDEHGRHMEGVHSVNRMRYLERIK